MADPFTLTIITAFVLKNAPSWLSSLGGIILDKGKEIAADKGKEIAVARGKGFMERILHLDEKEQLRHLNQALKNATERGIAPFSSPQAQAQYQHVVHTLSQPSPQGEALRREAMQCFTLSHMPDFTTLSDTYNRYQHDSNAAYQDIDVSPYLNSFFCALIEELYADPYFRPQLSDALQLRAANNMQQ